MKTPILSVVLLTAFLLVSLSCLEGQEYSPNQILFKTSRSLEIQRGRTGLIAFDSFLDDLQAVSVNPVEGMHGNRWFSAHLLSQPDWDAIRNNNLQFEGIDVIQPNYLNHFHVTPNDPWYSLQQLNLVSLPQAWNYTTGSSMIIIGIVDSGILINHPDLQDNIYYNTNEIPDNGIDDDNNGYIDDYCGWDFADAPEMSDVGLGDYTEPDNDPTDENFHGTHVAGIAGAVSNNGIGVSGVCWNIKLLALRAGFRTTSGTGFLQDDDAAAAIIYAADMGASVLNMSWGDPNYSAIIADACNYAYDRGIVLVASAGNDPGPYLSYPAKLASVISVGAVDPYKNLAGFSSYGPELDIVAPGQQIYSTYKESGSDMYEQMSGTSMSAPFVVGAVALLKSIQPTLTPEEVRARILTATDDLGEQGFDQYYGHGLLNVQKLLENESAPYIKVDYPADNIGTNSDFDIIGTVSSENFFRYSVMCSLQEEDVTPVWKDVYYNTMTPHFYYQPVTDGVIAHFMIPDLMQEGQYIIRIQYESTDGTIYNLFRSVRLDSSPPYMKANTFQVFKRYEGQNVRYYAGALFNEPVRSEMLITASDQSQYVALPAKVDSVQVWQLPADLPPGYISVRINAMNNSNLPYNSSIMPNVVNIQYDITPNYGFERTEIGPPLIPLNRFHDYDNNGVPEFITMELPTSGYGDDVFYELDGTNLVEKHSYTNRFLPLDLGNTNETGQELMGLNLETVTLYETLTQNLYPTVAIWSQTGVSGGKFADYNNDGTQDILLVENLPTERVIRIYKRLGATEISTPKITLHNNSPTILRNMFVPTVYCTNLDGDNKMDILTADTDGDLMIYEVTSSTTAELVWSTRLGIANTYYLTVGDFDGNGTKDFVVGGYTTDVLDPNQNYWLFEGFTNYGDNTYGTMGIFQFDHVMSQNAIQCYDLDGDLKDELILSLTPYLYVIKYINGEFKPIFTGNSEKTYQIATWNQDNQTYFLTNGVDDADSLKTFLWHRQAAFTGPSAPANFLATPMNGSRVDLHWQDNGAHLYKVFRKSDDETPHLLSEAYTNSFSDTTVVSGNTYYYAISCVNYAYTPEESKQTQWIPAIPMPQPVITEITMIGANELRVVFNQRLASTALISGCYSVNHAMGVPLSVNGVLNQYGVQLRFRYMFQPYADNYVLTMQNVCGATGVAPSQLVYNFSYNPDYTAPYIEYADVRKDKRSVDITLSESVSPGPAMDLSNYELILPANDSGNSIQSVSVNDNVITAVLSEPIKYSNRLYYIIIRNITDLAGNAIIANQNFCKFYLADVTNLDKVVTYPNPVKVSEYSAVNFLNFPPGKKGHLAIYNLSGDLVYQANIGPFDPANSNFTCSWELRNQSGKKICSGVYFYVINMGGDVKRGKIAVLN